MVRQRGFEPPRYCYRQPLKLVRLPVPPLPHSDILSRLNMNRQPPAAVPDFGQV
jgi:hypothetical protein